MKKKFFLMVFLTIVGFIEQTVAQITAESLIANESKLYVKTNKGTFLVTESGKNWEKTELDFKDYYESKKYTHIKKGLKLDDGSKWKFFTTSVIGNNTFASIIPSSEYSGYSTPELFILNEEKSGWKAVKYSGELAQKKSDRDICYLLESGHMIQSIDGGKTFFYIGNPPRYIHKSPNRVFSVMIGETFYCISEKELGISNDKGLTWEFLGVEAYAKTALEKEEQKAKEFANTDEGKKQADYKMAANNIKAIGDLTTIATNGKELFVGTSMGLFKVTENGKNWKKLNDPVSKNYIKNLFTKDNTLLTSYKGESEIYRSNNEGGIWTKTTGYNEFKSEPWISPFNSESSLDRTKNLIALDHDTVYYTNNLGDKIDVTVNYVGNVDGTKHKDKGLTGKKITSIVFEDRDLFVSTIDEEDKNPKLFKLKADRSAFEEVPYKQSAKREGIVYEMPSGFVIQSHDGGKTFFYSEIVSGLVGAERIGDVYYRAMAGSLKVSTDKGNSWVTYNVNDLNEAEIQKELGKILVYQKAISKDFKAEDYSKEEPVFPSGINISPTKAEQAATDLAVSGKTEEALFAFSAIYKSNRKNIYVLNELCKLFISIKDNLTANEINNELLVLSPDNQLFLFRQIKLSFELKKYEEAIKEADLFLKKSPSSSLAMLYKAKSLEQKIETAAAIEAYNKLLQIDPKVIAANRRLANIYLNSGNYDEAIKNFNKLINLNNQSTSTYNQRGLAYYYAGKTNEAIADYSKSIELAPNNYFALCNRGFAYLSIDKKEEAGKDFGEAYKFKPEYPDILLGRALFLENNNYFYAQEAIDEAIKLDPYNETYQTTKCKLLITEGLDKGFKLAIKIAEKVISVNEKNREAWFYKANAETFAQSHNDAIATMNKAISLMPNEYLFYALRAHIYRQIGNFTAADADDSKAKILSGNDQYRPLNLVPTGAYCLSGNCSDGLGTYRYENGDIYRGNFVNGSRHGEGTMQYYYGDVFEGTWENNNQSYGIFAKSNGYGFKGSYDKSGKELNGVRRSSSGEYYTIENGKIPSSTSSSSGFGNLKTKSCPACGGSGKIHQTYSGGQTVEKNGYKSTSFGGYSSCWKCSGSGRVSD